MWGGRVFGQCDWGWVEFRCGVAGTEANGPSGKFIGGFVSTVNEGQRGDRKRVGVV